MAILLPTLPSLGSSEVFGGLRGFPRRCRVEAAGAALIGHDKVAAVAEEKSQSYVALHSADEAAKAGMLGSDDYYELLGLGTQRARVSQEDIRRAYRDLCVKFHPDTLKRNVGVEDDESILFKSITKAFETLGDPKKRRVYDSKDGPEIRAIVNKPYDDSAFFRDFDAAIWKAAYWSAKPAPTLGDMNTPIDKVHEFYEFWFRFESWRDFSFLYNPDEQVGDSREERRYYEREAERTASKKKKDEIRLVQTLIENAYKWDPRLIRWRDEQKAAKEREREAKKEKLRKIEEDRIAKEQEEAKKAAEAAEAARREKDRVKREQRRQRKRIRDAMAAGKGKGLSSDAVDSLLEKISLDEMIVIADALEKEGNDTPLRDAVDSMQKGEQAVIDAKNAAAAKLAEEKAKEEAAKKQHQARPWTLEEEVALSKGVARFPPGTTDRWDRVSEYVSTRTAKEVKEMAVLLQSGVRPSQIGIKTAPKAEFKKKESRQVKMDAGTTDFERDAEKAEKEKAALAEATPAVVEKATTPTKAAPVEKPAEKKVEEKKPEVVKAEEKKPEEKKPEETKPEAKKEEVKESIWSPEQQAALESGLRKFPASDAERWQHIAATVEGKTQRECMLRYKELVARVKAQKAAAQTPAK